MSNTDIYRKTLEKLSNLNKVTSHDIFYHFRKNHNLEPVISKSELCYGSFSIKIDDLNFLLPERPISYLK